MRIQMLDPSAFTPPYDHALCAALARAGADVELQTSRFLYGPVPEPDGYRVTEAFYRASARRGLQAPGRRAFKAAEHLVDTVRWRRRTGAAVRGGGAAPEVLHFQWFTFPLLDSRLMSAPIPRVATAHYILPPGAPRHRRLAARAVFERMDAVIAHTEVGARRLVEEVGLDHDRVHVIPHGVFDHLPRLPHRRDLPAELIDAVEPESRPPHSPAAAESPTTAAGEPDPTRRERPVVLCFGLMRPYKGIEVLLEAFRDVPGAELWIAGNPRMDIEPLREAARHSASPVRFAPRFIEDAEIPALFERADLVVLPYLDIEQSGVLYTALAFAKPLILTEVGGFPEVVERTGAGRLVPPGDPAALASALNELIADPNERARLASAAAAAAGGDYSWDSIAERTLALYGELIGSRGR